MVCRCATPAEHSARQVAQALSNERQKSISDKEKILKLERDLAALSPDATKWELVDFLESGSYFIAKVKFLTCEHAGYGGHKILVFKATTKEAILWRRMNPHFMEVPKQQVQAKTEAPVPIARFPASPEGWEDAKAFVQIRNDRDKAKVAGIRGTLKDGGAFERFDP